MVEGELEYARDQNHEDADDVHAILLPPPGGQSDAVVTAMIVC